MIKRALWVLSGVICLTLTGCGYTSRSLFPEGIDSVAVEIVGNETFYREIETHLTRELTREIRERTPYKLSLVRHADAVLSGRILGVIRPTLVKNSVGMVSEQAVIVSVEMVLTDRRTSREIHRFRAANRAEFVVERGETLESAFAESIHDLAEDILNQLQTRSFEAALSRN